MNPRVDYDSLVSKISSKLKKRIFKKPNVNEAAESFGNLAKQLEKEECPEYAALHLLEKARCEAVLGNVAQEAMSLLTAADKFLQCFDHQDRLNILGPTDYIDWAVACTTRAAKLYELHGCTGLMLSCHVKLADTLKSYHFFSEAILHYRQCVPYVRHDFLFRSRVLTSLAVSYVKIRDFVGSQNAFSAAQSCLLDDGNVKCGTEEQYRYLELWCVLLALTVDPHSQRLVHGAKLPALQDYLLPSEKHLAKRLLDPDLYILIQSLFQASLSRSSHVLLPLLTMLEEFCDYDQTQVVNELRIAHHPS